MSESTLGAYKILDRVGSGGFAQVYLARDMRTNQVVALKVLRTDYAEDDEFISRFHHEADALCKLPRNPHIVTFHEFGEQDGTYYIALEYLEGHDLQDVIQRCGALPVDTAVSITAQIAEALSVAYKGGVVHRDVKPANIKINPKGVAKIMDFGIARAAEGTKLTRTGLFVGTPSYVAPEIWEGKPASAQSDVYALGMLLYEMLLGSAPFEATTPAAIMRKHLMESPPALNSTRSDVPDWLVQVAEKAIAKDPAQRYSEAGEMLADIQSHGQVQPRVDVDTLLKASAPIPVPAQAPRPGTGPGLPSRLISGAVAPPSRPLASRPVSQRRKPRPVLQIALGAAGMLGVLLIAAVGLAVANGGAAGFLPVAMRASNTPLPVPPTLTRTPTLTAVPTPTDTPLPSDTPMPSDTPTGQPSDTPSPSPTAATPTPSPSPTPTGPTPTPRPTNTPGPTPTPRATNTPGPTRSVPTTQPNALFDFETWSEWRRGDQPNGTLTQSTQQAHTGLASARLDYSFPSGGNDYVVFVKTIGLSSQANIVSAWVYGDGSSHFFNVWIKDSAGQVWQVPMGYTGGAGWQQKFGYILAGQRWPWAHISGPDNGQVDYPIQFYAVVVDDGVDTYSGSGTIYIDDIMAWRTDRLPTAEPAPVQPVPGQPTATPQPGPAPVVDSSQVGRIVFTAKVDQSYFIYHTDPGASNASELGRTDSGHTTCAGNASTLTGQSVGLYRGYRCGLGQGYTNCMSPNRAIEAVVGVPTDGDMTIILRPADRSSETFLFSGRLDPREPLAWSPDSTRFTFVGRDGTVYIATVNPLTYNPLTNGRDVMWSPDGTMILFSRPVNGAIRDLFVINPDGSGEHNITNAMLIDKQCPAWRQ